MAENLPPDLKVALTKYQDLQDKLQRLLAERSVIDSELKEINRVLQELGGIPQDATVYKIVGNLLVKVDKQTVEKELNDRKEILELRSRTYQKQEATFRTELENLQKKIQELYSKYYPQPSGATKA
ncbi:MAG: prefoldin subunit beta [Thermoprotei archaeon]